MELVSSMSKQRSLSAIDLVCVLLIGLGVGVFTMYLYVSNHPEMVRNTRSTIILTPRTSNDPTSAGKVLVKPSIKQEQI